MEAQEIICAVTQGVYELIFFHLGREYLIDDFKGGVQIFSVGLYDILIHGQSVSYIRWSVFL